MAKSRIWKGWLSGILATILLIPGLLSVFGVISIKVVLSDSMAPNINVNDIVVSANWIKPMPGEVAIYHQRDITGLVRQDVVHRVITRNAENEYQFKGDNNQSMDALLVPKTDVIGTVFLKLAGLGNLFTFAGLMILVLLIGGMCVVVWGIKKAVQTKDEA